jgi:hypothetical protein
MVVSHPAIHDSINGMKSGILLAVLMLHLTLLWPWPDVQVRATKQILATMPT